MTIITTFDPGFLSGTSLLSNGYLTVTDSAGDGVSVRSGVFKVAGKFHCEFTIAGSVAGDPGVGFCNDAKSIGAPGLAGAGLNSLGYYSDGLIWFNASGVLNTGVTYAGGDVVAMETDFDLRKVWFKKIGGNWNGSGTDNPATGTGGYSFIVNPGLYRAAVDTRQSTMTANFGATAFAIPASAGFLPWSAASDTILSDDRSRLVYASEVTTFSVPARIGT